MFVWRFQPVFIVRILFIATFLYSYILYKVVGTFWFRYILLIAILRGVFEVFTYIVTFIPNETFEFYGLVLLFSLVSFFIITWVNYYSNSLELATIGLGITLSFFRLFSVRFLLCIILIVVSSRYFDDGALCNIKGLVW